VEHLHLCRAGQKGWVRFRKRSLVVVVAAAVVVVRQVYLEYAVSNQMNVGGISIGSDLQERCGTLQEKVSCVGSSWLEGIGATGRNGKDLEALFGTNENATRRTARFGFRHVVGVG